MHSEVMRDYRMTIRLDASTAVPQPNGSIQVWGTAALVGVLDYSAEYGTREFRSEADTFDAGSMATLRGVALTLDHPDPAIDEGLVTPATVRELVHGWVIDVERRVLELRVLVCIASADALAAYNSGIRELSCGYRSRYIDEPGEWTGPDGVVHPYTGRQTAIRYNHLALVPLARAGHSARLDSAHRGTMKTIKIRTFTRFLPVFMAAAVEGQAAEHKKAIDAGTVRRDAIETEEVVIQGTTLILPKETVDALLVALGIGSSSTPADPMAADPMMAADPAADPTAAKDPAARMDARIQKLVGEAVAKAVPAALERTIAPAIAAALPKAVTTEVGSQVGARFDAIATRQRIVKLAVPILGDAFDYSGAKDEHEIAAAAVVRHDSKAKADVEGLAERARGGDLRAAGRLEERLETVARAHADASGGGAGFAIALDAARADAAKTDEQARADAEVDELDLARKNMNRRLQGKKPEEPKTTKTA